MVAELRRVTVMGCCTLVGDCHKSSFINANARPQLSHQQNTNTLSWRKALEWVCFYLLLRVGSVPKWSNKTLSHLDLSWNISNKNYTVLSWESRLIASSLACRRNAQIVQVVQNLKLRRVSSSQPRLTSWCGNVMNLCTRLFTSPGTRKSTRCGKYKWHTNFKEIEEDK